ncbi:hypothetical protein [Enterovirga sp.]|uniref:acyl carrier protein n=1 Tax=Enterovirga sp. TaxID=2026350 RepID=UPI002C220ACC|nr:hypothetical protein [Enterovirga sp.]HMO28102.1 hypothetical protein [Enterovirga sp.]
MKPPTPDAILQDLARILGDFDGREYSGEIGPKTLFFADLGFVSIDAVILAEKLEETYGRRFRFGEFLADLRERGARDIEIGELAAFLHGQMAQPGA